MTPSISKLINGNRINLFFAWLGRLSKIVPNGYQERLSCISAVNARDAADALKTTIKVGMAIQSKFLRLDMHVLKDRKDKPTSLI